MKNLFVPYEIALLLKDKGFDEPCMGMWHINADDVYDLYISYAEIQFFQVVHDKIYDKINVIYDKTHTMAPSRLTRILRPFL